MAQAPKPDDRANLGAAGIAAGLGCSIVVSIILGVVGGLLLDRATGRSPLFTLAGVALGLVLAAYQLYELATVGRSDRGPGPLARQIGRLSFNRKRPG